MSYPLFTEFSSSQYKSSFVFIVVIDVVPYRGLDDSIEESSHRDIVFRRRYSAPEKTFLLLVSCRHWFAYVLLSPLSAICL